MQPPGPWRLASTAGEGGIQIAFSTSAQAPAGAKRAKPSLRCSESSSISFDDGNGGVDDPMYEPDTKALEQGVPPAVGRRRRLHRRSSKVRSL